MRRNKHLLPKRQRWVKLKCIRVEPLHVKRTVMGHERRMLVHGDGGPGTWAVFERVWERRPSPRRRRRNKRRRAKRLAQKGAL